MKKVNIGIWAITLIIAGLMISVSGTAMIQNTANEEKTLVFERQEKTNIHMDSTQAKTLTMTKPSSSNILDVPAFDGIEPSVSHSGSTMVGASLDLEQENVYYWASIDGGETWFGGLGWVMEDIPEKPCVDGCGDGRYIASCVPGPYDRDGSITIKTTIDDAADMENTIGGSLWDWYDVGAGYTNFIDVEVAGYTATDPAENEWAYGCHAVIGDHGELGSQTGFFVYQADSGGIAWIYTLEDNPGDFNGATSCGVDIDHGTNFGYAVYNYDNGGTMDLYIFIMNFGTWGEYEGYPIHDETYDAYINSSGNDDIVDISALNDNVIIVSERDGAIVAYYSVDGLTNVNEVEIDSNGEQPRIVHTGDQSAVCSFIKDGVLYTAVTEDGGATWTTNQNSEEGPVESADICAFGALYDAEEIIYFAPIQTSIPIIEIASISGGIGVTALIQNTGTGDATDIEYTISATGGILGFINAENSGTISVPAGGETTINLPMFIGLGAVTISVTAGYASETASGTQILIYTMM